MKLLMSKEMDGKVYSLKSNARIAFASRLHEKIKAVVGRPMREVGEIDF